MDWSCLAAATFSAWAALGGVSAGRGCATVPARVLAGDAVRLFLDASVPRQSALAAIRRWARCPQYGAGFPRFEVDAPAAIEVTVRYDRGNSGSARCAFFAEREIVLFGSARDRAGKPVPCGGPELLLAHELGHVLGLGDAPRDARCAREIMAQDDARFAPQKDVQDEECAAADARWIAVRPAPQGY